MPARSNWTITIESGTFSKSLSSLRVEDWSSNLHAGEVAHHVREKLSARWSPRTELSLFWENQSQRKGLEEAEGKVKIYQGMLVPMCMHILLCTVTWYHLIRPKVEGGKSTQASRKGRGPELPILEPGLPSHPARIRHSPCPTLQSIRALSAFTQSLGTACLFFTPVLASLSTKSF